MPVLRTGAKRLMIDLLQSGTNTIPVLFLILGLGILLGRIRVRGCSLGSAAVLFVAIVAGHFGYKVPPILVEMGVVLFVYAIGLQAGPRFFKTFKSKGASFGMLALAALAAGGGATLVMAKLLGLEAGLSAGLFNGALTSTPGLAAAIDAAPPGDAGWAAHVSVGYGIAYPFGVAGVVLFVQLFPRLMKIDLKTEAVRERERQRERRLDGRWYRVTNPQLAGHSIAALMDLGIENASVTRVEKPDGHAHPANDDVLLETNDMLYVVSKPDSRKLLETVIGPIVEGKKRPQRDGDEVISRDVFVTETALAGKTLGELGVRDKYGVVVSRLIREEIEFVPNSGTRLEIGDLIRIVGSEDACERFTRLVGNVDKRLHETNFLPLSLGLVVGILVGRVAIPLPGTDAPFRLGLAGGPLLVALIAGHLGRVGPLSIRMPVASKVFIRELGLMFFLAGAGAKAGAGFIDVLTSSGPLLLLSGAVVTIAPMIAAWIVARKVLKLDVLSSLGAICGGMTSTPALGALSAASDSETPALAYATVYPAALVFVTIFAQIVARLLI